MSKNATISFAGATATAEGMLYNGHLCLPVIDQCEGCNRISAFEGQNYCSSYPVPSAKWALGRCNFATHVKMEIRATTKVNPLKASKRASKGK